MDAFETYQKFLALHHHFYNKNYDYFKYNGKVKVSFDKFMARPDRYHFHKLGKKSDPVNFIVANILLSKNKVWITELVKNDADINYALWKKYNESSQYSFVEDIKKINDLKESFVVKNGQHPRLLREYLRNNVSIYTLTILDIVLNYTGYWNKKIEDGIIWPEIYQKIVKFKPFLSIKKDKYKQLINDVIDEK